MCFVQTIQSSMDERKEARELEKHCSHSTGKKGKKNKEDLDQKRHIHTKEDTTKFFLHIVTTAFKPKVFKELSPFQIGAVSGHRAQEHLFSIKSVIALAEWRNEAILLQQYDFSKMFDRESLLDVLGELYRSNVQGKTYKLLYEMNKDRKIKVRTAVGDSEELETEESLGQGSNEGAIASTNSIAKGVKDFFENSKYEEFYGPLKLQPFQFIDDIINLCKNPNSAQMRNNKLENLAEVKLLDYNMSKTVIIILGKGKARKKLEDEFDEHNPTLYGKKVKIVSQETFLGDEIGKSVSESISLTIRKRIGLVKRSIYEIKAIVEDFRSQEAGSIVTGLVFWKSCVLPFLLYNSCTWLQMKNGDIELLYKIQRLFLNTILGVKNCPAMLMLWDLGMIDIPLLILKEKLLFYHHISSLSESSISRRILEIQEKYNFPSLRQEISVFLNKHDIYDVKQFEKHKWKEFVNRSIKSMNRTFLLERMKNYKKLDEVSLSLEEFEAK